MIKQSSGEISRENADARSPFEAEEARNAHSNPMNLCSATCRLA